MNKEIDQKQAYIPEYFLIFSNNISEGLVLKGFTRKQDLSIQVKTDLEKCDYKFLEVNDQDAYDKYFDHLELGITSVDLDDLDLSEKKFFFIIEGNVIDGINPIGAFIDGDAASEWGDFNLRGCDWILEDAEFMDKEDLKKLITPMVSLKEDGMSLS